MMTSTNSNGGVREVPATFDRVGMAPEETTKVTSERLVAKVKELLHEGTVRRIVVKNDEGHTVMEIPVTAAVVAVVALPIVTAIGAIAAFASDWTIQVYRQAEQSAGTAPNTASQVTGD